MVNHVDPSVPDREVMVMFNEAHGDKGKVTKERFCDTLLRHGLFEYQPRVSSMHAQLLQVVQGSHTRSHSPGRGSRGRCTTWAGDGCGQSHQR